VAITDPQGLYSFPDLADGTWTITIEMTGFAPLKQEVTVGPNAPAGTFAMKLLTLEQMRAATKPVTVEETAASASATAAKNSNPAASTSTGTTASTGTAAAGTASAAKKGAAATTEVASAAAPAAPEAEPEQDANAQQANDGLLINGSVNNAATSQFSMSQAFGNMRSGGRFLYNGGLSLNLSNSALNAEPYSLTGLPTANQSYNNFTFGAQFGGPLKLSHVIHYVPGSNFTVSYQRTQNSTLSTQSALVPTPAERAGNFSGMTIYNPATGNPFSGSVPISSQAQVLLNLYPQPLASLAGNPQYNYQASLANDTHQDGLSLRLNSPVGRRDSLNGGYSIQSGRSGSTSLFGFHDSTDSLGMSSNVNWTHRFQPRLWTSAGYTFSRNRSRVTPNFANRENIEGEAGISGASTVATYWGPPTLSFTSSGITALSDATSSNNRSETNSLSVSLDWYHQRHDITVGGDFRRQETNILSQSNPDGTLGFTGQATRSSTGAGGSDFADFLLGIPDTSQIAFGNADKYLRQSVYDLYASDDFRVSPALSVKWGVRWEYGAPITELKGRLVNLDVAPGFTAEQAVVGSNPAGTLSGQSYPAALIRPDRSGIAPNVGIAWRPISGSSLLVRSGYQISHDTSVYQSTAMAMMQQHGTAQTPLSTSLSISGSPGCQLSMANPFVAQTCTTTTTTPDSFAIDPNFRVGYIQIWMLSVQRDLPASLQMIATYTGNKGTRGVQEFLPNTAPPGATDPYAAYPSGYLYRTSNGNSTHEEGSVNLRRRLRAGLAAGVTYTFAKSLDDDYSLGGGGGVGSGPGVAQNWLDLSRGQRGLSTFDQRHVLSANAQYTTGMGLGGKTLMSGWKGLAYKEWSVNTTIRVASGLPETPTYGGAAVTGTGFTGPIRPNVTGVSPYSGLQAGYHLNPAAYSAPSGQWGNARRDSITGPMQFSMNLSMSRTFRLDKTFNLDTRIDATNILNHVTYSGWNTTYIPGSLQFGEPQGTNGMRTMQITMRLRF
jgi:hypothetical protein